MRLIHTERARQDIKWGPQAEHSADRCMPPESAGRFGPSTLGALMLASPGCLVYSDPELRRDADDHGIGAAQRWNSQYLRVSGLVSGTYILHWTSK